MSKNGFCSFYMLLELYNYGYLYWQDIKLIMIQINKPRCGFLGKIHRNKAYESIDSHFVNLEVLKKFCSFNPSKYRTREKN